MKAEARRMNEVGRSASSKKNSIYCTEVLLLLLHRLIMLIISLKILQ